MKFNNFHSVPYLANFLNYLFVQKCISNQMPNGLKKNQEESRIYDNWINIKHDLWLWKFGRKVLFYWIIKCHVFGIPGNQDSKKWNWRIIEKYWCCVHTFQPHWITIFGTNFIQKLSIVWNQSSSNFCFNFNSAKTKFVYDKCILKLNQIRLWYFNKSSISNSLCNRQ